jgi:hypothetical protein
LENRNAGHGSTTILSRRDKLYNRGMFRLLSIAAFATLLILVVCGAGSHKAQAHDVQLDRLELPPAVPSPTSLKFASDLNATTSSLPSIISATRSYNTRRLPATLPESISLQDPLSISSVLRV